MADTWADWSSTAGSNTPVGTDTPDDLHVQLQNIKAQVKENCIDETYIATLLGGCPIGFIGAWHKSFTNTPALPASWVECNGQVLSDADSPYNGQTIPDLNGGGRFLRGAATSGTMQADEIKAHHHPILLSNPSLEPGGNGYYAVSNTGGDFVTGDAGGTETRPINMSVVWIIKIKL